MARPVTISDEAILEAAREIFLAQGMKATTAAVAERAGVSEGIIFKRFKTKAELFRTAMHLEDSGAIWAILDRAGRGEIREQLRAIGQEMIGVFHRVIPILMMTWSSTSEIGVPAAEDGEPMAIRAIRAVSLYFEKEIALGRVPDRVAPEIYARTFMGSLWHFVMIAVLIPREHVLPMTAETYLEGVIDLVLDGAPASAPAAKRRPSKKKR